MDVVLEHLLRDCHPLLLQEPEELGTINRLGVIVPDPAPKNIPQMFYGRQIGRSGRPIQSHNLLMLHLIPDHPGAELEVPIIASIGASRTSRPRTLISTSSGLDAGLESLNDRVTHS
nr:hypothetical protein BaRGS_034580 [Batillaria attramentaria]